MNLKALLCAPPMSKSRYNLQEELLAFKAQGWRIRLTTLLRPEQLIKEIKEFEPDFVMLTALPLHPGDLNPIAKKFRSVSFIVVNYSSVTYTLAAQRQLLLPYYEQPVFCLRGAEVWSSIFRKKFYPYAKPFFSIKPQKAKIPEKPTVGLFARHSVFKNILNQAVAVTLSQAKKMFVLQYQPFYPIINQLKSQIEIEWVPEQSRKKFLEVLGQCSCTLQVSLTESCCFTALESMLMGVPCIGSNVISFIPPELQAVPESVIDIAKRINYALENLETVKRSVMKLAAKVQDANNSWFLKFIEFLEAQPLNQPDKVEWDLVPSLLLSE